ncbi:MAG TPA: 50S ribosomal protein L35 [bacterium]
MPKIKTVKGVKRRFKVSGTGKVRAFPPGRRHLLTNKRGKYKRHHRRRRLIPAPEAKQLRRLMPYA